jgi:hypothetical protein
MPHDLRGRVFGKGNVVRAHCQRKASITPTV